MKNHWHIRRRERLDGLEYLLDHSKGAFVLDVGCNRGLVGYELAIHGAQLIHGCDKYPDPIKTARHLYDDVEGVGYKFEQLDVSKGPGVFSVFEEQNPGLEYDIILLLGVYHKLKRQMAERELRELLEYLGRKTKSWFAWNGKDEHFLEINSYMKTAGMALFSRENVTDHPLEPVAALWRR